MHTSEERDTYFILENRVYQRQSGCLSNCSIFSRKIFVVEQPPCKLIYDNGKGIDKKSADTIVLRIRQMSGICILFTKIEFIKGNLDVFPTLFNYFAQNFCHCLTSLQISFQQW